MIPFIRATHANTIDALDIMLKEAQDLSMLLIGTTLPVKDSLNPTKQSERDNTNFFGQIQEQQLIIVRRMAVISDTLRNLREKIEADVSTTSVAKTPEDKDIENHLAGQLLDNMSELK